MSEETDKTGGPAFPVVAEGGTESGLHPTIEHGMTLRDYFAGQALAASDWSSWEARHGLDRGLAGECYAKADAMLEQRKRGRR